MLTPQVAPIDFWVEAATHLPEEQVFPVSQSVFALQAALQTLFAVVAEQILLVHCDAEVQTAPFARFVDALRLVAGCIVCKFWIVIACPVIGLSFNPDVNVSGIFAATAAHCPKTVEPIVTLFAQLLLAQSAFSLHGPPIFWGAMHTPASALGIMHTFPVPHWVFNVQGAHLLVTIAVVVPAVAWQYPLAQLAFVVHDCPLAVVPAALPEFKESPVEPLAPPDTAPPVPAAALQSVLHLALHAVMQGLYPVLSS